MIEQIQDTVYALAASGNTLYTARGSGLYRSSDAGKSWHDVLASLEQRAPLTVTALAVDGDNLFAGTNGAVLRSQDGGESWQIAALSSPPPQVSALVISPNFSEDGTVVAGTSQDGVFVSTDRGATWTPWNFGLIDLNVYALAISLDFRRDQMIISGTVSGIFRSLNAGRSWHEVSFPIDAAPVLSLAISSAGLLYAGTEAHGLFASDDFGLNWDPVNNGFASSGINAIHISASRTWLLLEDQLVSSSDGESWHEHPEQIPSGKIGMTLLPHPTAPGTVLVGFADGDLLYLC